MKNSIKTFEAFDSAGTAYRVLVIQNYQREEYLDGSTSYTALLPEIRLDTGESCNLVDQVKGILRVISSGTEIKAVDWEWG